jgi:hypothetical protein
MPVDMRHRLLRPVRLENVVALFRREVALDEPLLIHARHRILRPQRRRKIFEDPLRCARQPRDRLLFLQTPIEQMADVSLGSVAVRRCARLSARQRELEVAYCRLVTISTDNITETNEYRSGIDAHWPFLSDAGRLVQKDLDIAEYTDPVHNPMIPHVIVLEPGLVVYKVYNGYWFFGRPTLEELRQDLRAVTRKCRPDWDITTPELKAAWREGRKELFYPYGKTFAQTLGEQD